MALFEKGHIVSEEVRNKVSRKLKKLWTDKAFRERMLKANHNPEVEQRRSKARTGQKLSKESCERMRIAQLGNKHSLETRLKMSQSQKGKIHTKQHNMNVAIALKKVMSRPEVRLKISKALSGRKLSKERCEQIRKTVNKPEIKSKISKTLKIVLNRPEVKEKFRKARLKQILPAKDTKIEVLLQDELSSRKIRFEKHHSFMGKYQPDLYLPEFNTIIFADGCYWHGCGKHCPNSPHKRHDALQKHCLEKIGYKVFRFWEHDINQSPSACIDKVFKNFGN